MKKPQVLEAVLSGQSVSVVELRAVEAGKFDAKPEKNKPESHYLKYAVIKGNDSAEVTLYAEKGILTPPAALKFNKGQLAVVVGDFYRTEYGMRCRADSIELLAE